MLKQNKKDKQQDGHRWLLIGFLCLFAVCLVAQVKPTGRLKRLRLRLRKLWMERSKLVKISRKSPKIRRRKYICFMQSGTGRQACPTGCSGTDWNVKLRHDSMYMFCDSALIYEKTNSVEAFSNVRMEQGDTLFIYGDYLYYDGMTQIAQIRENVKMINRNTTLLTDSLNYDRLYDLGYYFEGGTLMDEENVLTSDWGEYSPATKQSVFNHDVKLVNPKFVLTSDTLKYNTFPRLLPFSVLRIS